MIGSMLCMYAAWYQGVFKMKGLESVTVTADTALFSGEAAAEKMKLDRVERELESFAVWESHGLDFVRAQGTGREGETAVIECQGDMSLIVQERYVAGGALTFWDASGCVVSEQTAQQLFQSSSILGMPVEFRNKTYYVRGVLDTKQPLLFLGTEDKSRMFCHMELAFGDKGNSWQLAKNYLNEQGIYDKVRLLDGAFAVELTRVLAGIPVWGLIIGSCIAGIGKISLVCDNRYIFWAAAGGIVLTGYFILGRSGFHMTIPDSMIPPKWSDFEFYAEKAQEIRTTLQAMSNDAQTLKQMRIRGCLSGTLIALIAAVLLELSGSCIIQLSFSPTSS